MVDIAWSVDILLFPDFKIFMFLSLTGSNEDVFHQLEREVSYNNNVINQLQEEINDLQQMCCILKEVSN